MLLISPYLDIHKYTLRVANSSTVQPFKAHAALVLDECQFPTSCSFWLPFNPFPLALAPCIILSSQIQSTCQFKVVSSSFQGIVQLPSVLQGPLYCPSFIHPWTNIYGTTNVCDTIDIYITLPGLPEAKGQSAFLGSQ